jgi:PadR family transcriptional regulator, regulatory protein PadR
VKDVNQDNTADNRATDARLQHWLVPVLLLLLQESSWYSDELLDLLVAFGLGDIDMDTFCQTLGQMESDGLIRSRWETAEAGLTRRVYMITLQGKTTLQSWLDAPESPAEDELIQPSLHRSANTQG